MTSLSDDKPAALRIIPQGTFRVLMQIDGGRFRTRLEIQGPIADYSDDELLLHFGGDARFGDKVDRGADNRAWVHVWSD